MQRKGIYCGGAIAALAAAVPGHAQLAGHIDVENRHNFKIKVCTYDPKQKLSLVPKACVSVDAKQRKQFPNLYRAQNFRFKVFQVGKVLDKHLCNYGPITIPEKLDRFVAEDNCIKAVRRSARPTPRPPVPKKYTLNACNKIDETVYFTLAYFVKYPIQYKSEGWWSVKPGKCRNIDLEKLWSNGGTPPGFRAQTFIYGETAGFLGIVKKVWEADKAKPGLQGNVFCVRMPKDRTFLTVRGISDRGTRLSDACSASTYDKVVMEELDYSRTGAAQFNFGGR